MALNHPAPRHRSGHPSLNKEGIKKVQRFIKEEKLEGFLVLTRINWQYLSGFTGSAGAVLVTKKGAELFVDDRYTLRARRESALPVYPLTRLSATLSRSGRGKRVRVGVEDRISIREFAKLKKDYAKVKLVITHDEIENLRAVKSREEMRNIQKGSEIVDKIFRLIVKLLKKNSPFPSLSKRGGRGEFTEIAIAQEIQKMAMKLGADGLAFDPIVAFGSNAAAPHHFVSSQKIGRNNFLLLDFGVLVRGYHSDFTRTLFIGRPNKKQEKVYHTVLGAQLAALDKVEIGQRASRVDRAARDFIAKSGFGRFFTHNTGHGVGLEIHELPNFSASSEDVLRKDMIVTVEPGIYIEKWGGVRIEDMVQVDRLSRVLSKIPQDLRSMIIK